MPASVLRSGHASSRKKGRTLGAVDGSSTREEYAGLEVACTRVELIRSLRSTAAPLMHIEELLDEEVTALAGDATTVARKAPVSPCGSPSWLYNVPGR